MTTTHDDPQLRDGSPPGHNASLGRGAPPSGDELPQWAQEHSAADRELLDRMVACKVAQNQAHAARLDALFSFHARRVEEQKGRRPEPGSGFFQITPLRETQAETAPLTGVSEHSVQIDLDVAGELKRWLPRLWERFRSGRLDLGKATACLDQLVHLASDANRATYAAAVQDWFDKHDPLTDPDGPLCTLTRDKIQRAAYHQRIKLPQRSDSETFAEAFKKRRVSLRIDEESGMACLSATTAAHDALTADHRLTLIAKKRSQAPGETRTLAQLRVDSLIELIHGRLTVPATTGDLEHHEHCDDTCRVNGADGSDYHDGHGEPVREGAGGSEQRTCPLHPLVLTTEKGGPLGGYARPVVVVTVPITTLMGLSNDPGVLSGGQAVPSEYARHIATQPGSTWYRMLTDEAGNFLELSTESYQATDPLWCTVVVRDNTCVWPGCRRPSVACDCDHRVPYPAGKTCIHNLAPLCERHHQVKHADGYEVVANTDGSYAWTTRHGSTFTTPATEQPVATWPTPTPDANEESAGIDEEFAALTGPLERAFAELIPS